MTWEEIMRRVLPPVGGLSPQITKPGAFGAGVEQGRHPPSSIPHKGVDFNYPVGQAGINKSYPMLHSPVAGVITNAGEGHVGRIAIRDANGFTHEILHTHSQSVRKGDLVGVGTPIGTMGNTGVNHTNPERGDYHVHYQLKDRSGNVVNATEFWNSLAPGKDDPGQPAFLDQSRRAAEILSGLNEETPLNGTPPPDRPSQPFFNPSSQTGPARAVAALAPTPDGSSFFTDRYPTWGSVPLPDPPAASDDPASFADRFGKWASGLSGVPGDVGAPASRGSDRSQRSEIPDGMTAASVTTEDDSTPVRRLVNLSSPASAGAPPLAPSAPTTLLGILSGQPMRDYPVPPSIFQTKDQSWPDDDELFRRWMRMLDA